MTPCSDLALYIAGLQVTHVGERDGATFHVKLSGQPKPARVTICPDAPAYGYGSLGPAGRKPRGMKLGGLTASAGQMLDLASRL